MVVRVNAGNQALLDFGRSAVFNFKNGELTTTLMDTQENKAYPLTAPFSAHGLHHVVVTHQYPATHHMVVDGNKLTYNVC